MRLTRALLCSIVVCAVAVTSLATPAFAQQTASVAGRVTSTDGVPLEGVAVLATRVGSAEQKVTATARTGRDGRYEVTGLSPATYTVTFTLPGYRTTARTDVRADSGRVTADATLSLWPRVGEAFDRDAMDGVPTARDPWVVAALTPGITLAG